MRGLASLVIDEALFLVTVDDEVLDPDVAVSRLEELRSATLSLTADEQEGLRAALSDRRQTIEPQHLATLNEIQENLGL